MSHDIRFSPVSDQIAALRQPTQRAKSGLMQRSKQHGHSITPARSSGLGHTQDWLDGRAALTVGGSLVDLIDTVKLDQTIKWKSALTVQFDELGDKQFRHAVALNDSADAFARRHQAAHIEAGRGPDWCRTNDAASAAAAECVDGLTHNLGTASRFERKIGAAIGERMDRGKEMADHKNFTVATNVQVYFCDPRSPWQRGSNENTNGLLRQYFPRGTDLSRFSQVYLNKIALRLNQRPRKTLGFDTPADRLQAVLH